VTGEVARLNRIVDDISGFAHRGARARALDVPALLRRAVELARARCPHVPRSWTCACAPCSRPPWAIRARWPTAWPI